MDGTFRTLISGVARGYKLVPESSSKTLQSVLERCCSVADRRRTAVLAACLACCNCLKPLNGGVSNSASDIGARSATWLPGSATSRGDEGLCRRLSSPPCIAGRRSPLLEPTPKVTLRQALFVPRSPVLKGTTS